MSFSCQIFSCSVNSTKLYTPWNTADIDGEGFSRAAQLQRRVLRQNRGRHLSYRRGGCRILLSRKCWRSAGRVWASSCQVSSLRRVAKMGRVDCGENGVPGLDEVVASGVAEDAEGCVGAVGGEDIADELIAGDANT